VDDFIRKGYRGGLTRAVRRGIYSSTAHIVDYNSFFPTMFTQPMPYGKPVHHASVPYEDTYEWLKVHRGFYNIVVHKAPDLVHQLYEETNKVYDAEETDTILRAIELGYIITVLDGYEFNYSPYMKNWVDAMYVHKEHAKSKIEREIAKLFLNSLYGAMGTKWKQRQQFTTYGEEYTKQLSNTELLGTMSGSVRDGIWCGTETTDAIIDDINVAISSCVTSRARLALFETMHALGDKVLYVDTDSLIITGELPEWLQDEIHPTALGKLKIVDKAKRVNIVSNKMYSYIATDGRIVPKMLSVQTDHETKYNALETMINGKSIPITQTRLYKPRQAMFSDEPIIERILGFVYNAIPAK